MAAPGFIKLSRISANLAEWDRGGHTHFEVVIVRMAVQTMCVHVRVSVCAHVDVHYMCLLLPVSDVNDHKASFVPNCIKLPQCLTEWEERYHYRPV